MLEDYSDLAKTFDCVNHEILPTKLYFLAFKEHQHVGSNPVQQTVNKRLK
jgi:hypothetical protein